MTIFLIIGVLIPIIFIMRLNAKNQGMNLKLFLHTIGYSVVGIVITTTIGTMVTKSHNSILLVIIGSIIVGVIWGILLALSYIFFNFLSNTFKK
ncbi:putative membrane protein YeaQ/YmgE (transglycosylase-associated protein family) [Staphylococcus pasteuri]|uniref:MW1603 protein n=2 Tax=Staphylococcus TaxID=1279 RepID=A0ABY1H4G5_9STAP|nr:MULTISPECIES: hypothetical protein [Staphylococcus]ATH62464.1 hypothetical protein BJG87_05525 [Staphylococcus pasteuri]KKI57578.1 hypothetical protein UF70_1221 [Staphylococcus pasteuri]MCF7599325.1 hypothetical protein [Staphylococcus pasteuri]MDO6573326.1 hypothetical protein [Staphylococcus pasteuri_A]MEB6208927.1 hypothetical protein [Staphylococcus pasteuri]